MSRLKLRDLLLAGVHFGHQARRWNPKMAPYIFATRNKIHIIDIIQTQQCLQLTCAFLRQVNHRTKKILFVGTKPQLAKSVSTAAQKIDGYYVNQKWLGGMLTNWTTMRECIKRLNELDNILSQSPKTLNLRKKELSVLRKHKAKLEKYFAGLRMMNAQPEIVILVGQQRELTAVQECQKLGITTITILDTNCDPDLTDYGIPGNDDSIRAVELIFNELTSAILQG